MREKERESEGKRERVRDRNIVLPLVSIYIKYFPKHKELARFALANFVRQLHSHCKQKVRVAEE